MKPSKRINEIYKELLLEQYQEIQKENDKTHIPNKPGLLGKAIVIYLDEREILY